MDLDAEWRLRVQAGQRTDISAGDLYPDAVPSLTALRQCGYRIGIAGNQPARAGQALCDLRLPADFIATSAEWESRKPAAGFFGEVAEAADLPPAQILYVGDRLVDNDILPAHEAGFATAFIRRGPWGYLQAGSPGVCNADMVLQGLDELPALLPGPPL